MNKLRTLTHYLYLPLIVLIIGCGNEKRPPEAKPIAPPVEKKILPKESALPVGEVIPLVQMRSNSRQSYALYLPTNYTVDTPMPILLAFDSQGNGGFPVRKYKDLAEKYGWILIGSNDSRNGQPGAETMDIVRVLVDEVRDRYPLYPERLYTTGFSGGARVAALTAVETQAIAGVIGCGAGFPQLEGPIGKRFDFISIVGVKDFNYIELVDLQNRLNKAQMRNFMLEFEGGHEWPTVELMEEGIWWLELNAMRDGKITRNEELIETVAKRFAEQDKEFERKKDMLGQQRHGKKGVFFLYDLHPDGATYQLNREQLHALPEVQAGVKDLQTSLMTEQESRKQFQSDILDKDAAYWKREVSRMQKLCDKSSTFMEKMNCRLLNHLSITCFMNITNGIRMKQMETAKKMLDLYGLVDAENADQPFLYARFIWSKTILKKHCNP